MPEAFCASEQCLGIGKTSASAKDGGGWMGSLTSISACGQDAGVTKYNFENHNAQPARTVELPTAATAITDMAPGTNSSLTPSLPSFIKSLRVEPVETAVENLISCVQHYLRTIQFANHDSEVYSNESRSQAQSHAPPQQQNYFSGLCRSQKHLSQAG